MSYTLIKGEYHIHYPANPRSGPEPDGDTIKFKPDNRALVESLPRPNRPPGFNRDGITTLRFEGIDTLETHFSVEGQTLEQRLDLALAARDAMLAKAGFGQVTFFPGSFKVQAVENHPIRGYILSNGLDTFGRVIAFLYTGDHPSLDGSRTFVLPQDLDASLNAYLLETGHAYGAFYASLPQDLRAHLKAKVQAARAAGAGLWPQDTARPGAPAQIADITGLQALVMWPKLFRRLASFFGTGNTDLATFDAWLRLDPVHRDDRVLLPGPELGNMHDLITVSGTSVRLAHLPEDVVIVPDDYQLAPDVSTSEVTAAGSGPVFIVAALINPLGEDRGRETVTLLNAGPADVDLTGWRLADATGSQPLSGALASGEAVRVACAGTVQLSNTRDTITVLDATGAWVHQVSYEARHLPAPGSTMRF